MNCFNPGDRQITDRAIELCGLKTGDLILDLGCGEGETMIYLRDRYGLSSIGCDTNDAIIKRAKANDPKLNILKCDGVALDFPSLYFDGAIMECSFSLMTRHLELLHELYCILKPGATIAISDLYMLDPDLVRTREHKKTALEFLNRPRIHNACENETVYPSPCVLDGMFIKDFLLETLKETGFELITWEDKTQDLRNYIAQVLMDYGSFENMWKAKLPEGAEVNEFCNVEYSKNTGYFLLSAKKVV